MPPAPQASEASASEDDLGRLLQEMEPRFAAVLHAFRVPEADADDLLQDVLMAFILKRESIRCPERWLLQALRLACRMHWRSVVRRRRLEKEAAALSRRPGEPGEALELHCDLEVGLRALPPRPRAVVLLRYWSGCGDREIATLTDYAPGSVDTTLRRGLAELRRRLRGHPRRAS